jgi:glucose-1-phosphate thymidylyltransferase
MKALILGGGLGTRLHPITKITPKSLIDIKGKPLIAHLLDSLEKSKYVDEIYITYNHKFGDQFASLLEHFRYGKKIELVSDKDRGTSEMPGSIGTISYFVKLKKIKEDLLILAGDSLFSFEIDDFIDFFKKKGKTCIAAYDIGNKDRAANKYGVIGLDTEGKILSFEEKPKEPKTSLVATLCYLLSNYDLHHLDRKTFKENAGELIAHLAEHEEVYAYVFRGKWFDIGTHEDLEKTRREF